MNDCSRALSLMPEYVDGELATDQSGWIGQHLDSCSECRDALGSLIEADSELVAWGQSLERANPPAPDARDQLASTLRVRRHRVRWIPIASGALAAGLALVVIALHRVPAAGTGDRNRETSSFVAIPYLPAIDPRENGAIVRMDIQVATLIAAGYRIAAEPGAIVPADVLVGEDGRARAVRVLSDIELKGRGD